MRKRRSIFAALCNPARRNLSRKLPRRFLRVIPQHRRKSTFFSCGKIGSFGAQSGCVSKNASLYFTAGRSGYNRIHSSCSFRASAFSPAEYAQYTASISGIAPRSSGFSKSPSAEWSLALYAERYQKYAEEKSFFRLKIRPSAHNTPARGAP